MLHFLALLSIMKISTVLPDLLLFLSFSPTYSYQYTFFYEKSVCLLDCQAEVWSFSWSNREYLERHPWRNFCDDNHILRNFGLLFKERILSYQLGTFRLKREFVEHLKFVLKIFPLFVFIFDASKYDVHHQMTLIVKERMMLR